MLSMTGFGHAELSLGDLVIGVEAKTVNHRFLDVVWRLPAAYSSFEQDLSRLVREKFKRGRVDITVNRHKKAASDYEIIFDEDLFKQYLTILKSALKSALGKDHDALEHAVVNLLQRREVLDILPKPGDVISERALLESALQEALNGVQEMRVAEGKALERDLESRLLKLENIAAQILPLAENSTGAYRERLRTKLDRLGAEVQVDAQRLAQEVALFAERSDVSEEISRLESHIAQFRTATREIGNGRKLDFLIQEMGREINTTGSKSQSAEISALIVEAKAELEKLREQVQNVE